MKRYIQQSLWIMMARGIAVVGNLGILYLLNQLLTKADFGGYAMATSLASTLAILFGFSFTDLFTTKGTRLLAEEKSWSARKLAGGIFWLSLIISSVGIMVFSLFHGPISRLIHFPDLGQWLLMIGAVTITSILFLIYQSWYNLRQAIHQIIFQQQAMKTIWLLILLGIGLMVPNPILWVSFATILASFLILIPFLLKDPIFLPIQVFRPSFADLKFCTFSFANGFLVNLLLTLDMFFLNYYTNATVVADYQMALRFGLLSAIGTDIFAPLLNSVVTKIFHNPDANAAIEQVNKKAILPMASIWVGIMIVFAFCGRWVLGLFGDYAHIYHLVFFICAIRALPLVFGVTSLLLILKERSDLLFINTLVSLGVNIGLNILLIPRIGIYGAALAAWVSIALMFLQRLLMIHKTLRYTMSHYLGYYALLVGVMGLFILLNNLWLQIGFTVIGAGVMLRYWKTLLEIVYELYS